MTELSGQVAVISGALGDIGRAIGLELGRRGADVALGDILDPARANSLLEDLRALGRRARYDRADVADPAAVTDWIEKVEKELGPPTLIIPNAAIVHFTPFTDLSPHAWRHELSVNLDGAFHLAHAATLRLLHHRRGGRVVFVGSWAGHAVHTHIPAYCVSKAGLRMLSRCMAAELAPHGILVNEVAPGYVDAGLTAQIFAAEPKKRQAARQTVPVRQLIEPEEVAVQVAALCDPSSRHLAGMTLLMDGGLSLLGPGAERERDD